MEIKEYLKGLDITIGAKVREYKDKDTGLLEVTYSTSDNNFEILKCVLKKETRNHLVYKVTRQTQYSSPDRTSSTPEPLLSPEEKRDDAVKFCRNRYPALSTTEKHPYLESKKIKGKFKVSGDYLSIPIYNIDEELISIQYITTEFKRFKKHTKPLDEVGFYTSTPNFKDRQYDYIYICEGFADNYTIKLHTNPRKSLVVSALSSSNIALIYQRLRLLYQNSKIILVLDSNQTELDYTEQLHKDKDLGIVSVKSAKKNISDINDLYVADNPKVEKPKGVYKRSNICKYLLNDFKNIFFEVFFLGQDAGGNYYLSSSENNTLIKLPSTFSKRHLKQVALDSFWLKKFPLIKTNKEGYKSMSIDWNKATEWIEIESRATTFYDPSKIISSGVSYNELDKNIVCNQGDGKENVVGTKQKGKIYIKGIKYPSPNEEEPINFTPEVIKLYNYIQFNHPKTGMILLAFTALSTIASGLPWRPIAYLMGDSDSGKSTVLSLFYRQAIGDFLHMSMGDATAAAIRRSLNSRGIPCMIDEYEFKPHMKGHQEAVNQILRNSCSSESGVATHICGEKGSVDSFEIRSSFLLASIKQSMTETALLNRTIFLTPNAEEAQKGQFTRLQQMASKIDLRKEFKGYYATLFHNAEQLKKFYYEYLEEYKKIGGVSVGHFSKNMAMINATIRTLTKGFNDKNILTKEELLYHSSDGLNEDGVFEKEDSESLEFIKKLKETMISYNGASFETLSVNNMVNRILADSYYTQGLTDSLYDQSGIYINKREEICLNYKHSSLRKICYPIVEFKGIRKLLKNSFKLPQTRIRFSDGDVRGYDISKFFKK